MPKGNDSLIGHFTFHKGTQQVQELSQKQKNLWAVAQAYKQWSQRDRVHPETLQDHYLVRQAPEPQKTARQALSGTW